MTLFSICFKRVLFNDTLGRCLAPPRLSKERHILIADWLNEIQRSQ